MTTEAVLDPAKNDARSSGASAGEPVFRARGLTRIYLMGEVEVPALQDVDLDLFPRTA